MTGCVVSAPDRLVSSSADLDRFGRELVSAFNEGGIFYLVDHGISPDLLDAVIDETAAFFAQSEEEKLSIHIKKSPHFRGYGILKNERDWREQIHLGPEPTDCNFFSSHSQDEQPHKVDHEHAAYWQLWGANQWPNSTEDRFKRIMMSYFAAIEGLSKYLLSAIAASIGKGSDFFSARMKNRPYLLMKAMSYLPQEALGSAEKEMQYGVTAHCDWSWLTFLLQDQVGGLECQDRSGQWRPLQPLAGSLLVNAGELLEIETGGDIFASPHRVINSRIDRQRYSVPVFINPALDSTIFPSGSFLKTSDQISKTHTKSESQIQPHVHKVIKPGSQSGSFLFGESEWERKGRGKWCYQTECLTPY